MPNIKEQNFITHCLIIYDLVRSNKNQFMKKTKQL